jgi:hypothetical protein
MRALAAATRFSRSFSFSLFLAAAAAAAAADFDAGRAGPRRSRYGARRSEAASCEPRTRAEA